MLKSKCDSVSMNDETEQLNCWLDTMKSMICNKFSSTAPLLKVGNVPSPEELMEKLGGLNLDDNGSTPTEMVNMMKMILDYSPNTQHPLFLDKLYASTSPIGIMAELIIATLNTNAHVYNVSPVVTLMEKRCIDEMCKFVGFVDGGGFLNPGGSQSILTAMVTARNYLLKSIKHKGMVLSESKPLTVFTSAHGHYSIDKGAMVMGIGLDQVIKIKAPEGKMDPEELEEKIKKSLQDGHQPFFVNCTAGTTVLGAFDNINEISKICAKYGLWCHVDASWGGPVIFSKRYKHLINGLANVQSININPHKLLGVPIQCSVLLTYNKKILSENSLNAQYLFHGGEYDIGDFTLGCGRRADGIKLYLCWMYFGTNGFAAKVEHAFEIAQYMTMKVKNTVNLLMVQDPSFVNTCFWYLPSDILKNYTKEQIRDILNDNQNSDREHLFKRLEFYTSNIHKELQSNLTIMIDYAPIDRLPKFFRIPFVSFKVTNTHVDFIVNEIVKIGMKIEER
ncbi:unnamed protein product [Didymodactylos carnosus]|uniref:Glutamate decarboxylase n=1 Tax=Didymodactylos carnosus TaxID=1234261 RepID=A0A8S2E9H8_9BILA|nr:unnamed protein product [Didymodactylos carnosus]CAF3878513.1 unnamed protein product [Didymodactylos carnosus]